MGLRETFHRGALTAMNAAGNVPHVCIFHKRGYGDSGQPLPGDAATIPALRVIRQDFTIEKVDGSAVLMQDRRYLAVALDMGNIVPVEDDTLEFSAEDIWTVVRVIHDPAGATYLMHVRR